MTSQPFPEEPEPDAAPAAGSPTRPDRAVRLAVEAVHTVVCVTLMRMARVDRFSITMPPELGDGVRKAAEREGVSVSAWLAEAAADRLRNHLLGVALDAWQAEDGAFTQEELDEAAASLGLRRRPDVA